MTEQKGRRLIDFHTHIFPEKIAARTIASLEEHAGIKAKTDGTLQGLLQSMERTNVDLSVIMPVVTKPEQFKTVNDFAAKTNARYEGKLLSFGGIHPADAQGDSTQYRQELRYIKDLGLKGIKLHPDYQETMIDDIGYLRIIDYATELGLIVLTHAGIDIGFPAPVHCPPEKARKVIDEVKPTKLVLAHTGGWRQWEDVEKYLVGCDVWFDTAFTSPYIRKEQFERIVRNHGADKVLFATDSPWENPADTINWMESTSLTDEEKKKIYGENAGKLLTI